MTRKDYTALARAFKTAHETAIKADDLWNLAYDAGRQDAARFVADVLEADNPAFNRDRFLEACQVTP